MSEQDNTKKPGPQRPVRMRVKIDDGVAKGTYSNTVFVHNNEMEFVLDFLFADPQRVQGQVVSRVITNPKAAKRLSIGLQELVKRYEERFGEIELPKAQPIEPGNYH